MHDRLRRPRLSVLGLLVPALLLTTGACARNLPEVSPEDIPTLEQQLSSSPDDPDLQTRLGIAYYQADRFEEARSTLQAAIEDGAESGAAHLHLGLAQEELENWSEARRAYSSYLDAGGSGPLVEDIEARLTYLVHRELQAEARRALEREDELSDEPPEPRTVAVFPFRLVSERPDLEPLSVALADMMITDLSLVGDLTVLERTKIQTLLNEMALNEAGYTEASTGARAGRILQAEHVVQGALSTVGTETLEMSTQVQQTVRRQMAGEFTGQEPLQQLFDLEKQSVFQVLNALGVELTPAERESINENRTENIQAFLAFGRGLQAVDRGDYNEAAQQFGRAVELDPGFDRAQSQAQEATQVQQAANTSTAAISQQASGTTGQTQGASDTPVGQTNQNLLQQTANQTNPNPGQTYTNQGSPQSGTDQQTGTRDPTQEAKGSDTVTEQPEGVITIQIGPPPPSDDGGGDR